MSAVAILTIMNEVLPRMVGLYKRVRGEARALDSTVQAFSDADMIEMLQAESTETVELADTLLAKYADPPPDDPA